MLQRHFVLDSLSSKLTMGIHGVGDSAICQSYHKSNTSSMKELNFDISIRLDNLQVSPES